MPSVRTGIKLKPCAVKRKFIERTAIPTPRHPRHPRNTTIPLLSELRQLIESARQRAAVAVNAELTLLERTAISRKPIDLLIRNHPVTPEW